MSFKVRLFLGAPDFETLHVAKLREYPLEPRDYKPYAQARICFAADGLHVQLLSFESKPLPQSEVRVVLALTPGAPPLIISLRADCVFGARRGEADLSDSSRAFVHPFQGGDLQGVYWGGNIRVEPAVYAGDFVPHKDAAFFGNFYKLCEHPTRPHYGSFYPADFSQPLDCTANLGPFVVIDY